MFEKITPEQAGISSQNVINLIKKLEKRGARMHGILMMREGKILTEAYWKPFNRDFCHRMYSQTKSFVGVAIGLLEEEGKLSLDDKILDYFPEKIKSDVHPYLREQTIKDMLTMTTVGGSSSWFAAGAQDRTEHYINDVRPMHPSGTLWTYDSPGSQVLSSLVEKLSGKTLLEYMREKLFDKMGMFKTATVLKTPNGDSWGDSAMVCTLRDIAAFGQLLMNYGVWEGKRLMNEKYLRTATSAVVDNHLDFNYSSTRFGYGYQIWRVSGNGFAFNGMGGQFTFCYPDKNFLFTCNADNQGTKLITELILSELEYSFIDTMKDTPLKENAAAQKELDKLISGLELRSAQGASDSPFRKELSGTQYVCEENPMGIEKFSLVFKDEKSGEFHYTNAQGDKVIPFGINHNVFGKFPQLGYANEYGNVPTTDGFMYDDAVSAAWVEEKKLMIYVQIIDRYFGNLCMQFAFKNDEVYARFTKVAEFFLNEYNGTLIGRKSK